MIASAVDGGDFVEQRRRLVQRIEREGIADRQVLEAMAVVPREEFVPDELRGYAYRDGPLPIGHGQTISQPTMVAMMAAEVYEFFPDVVDQHFGCMAELVETMGDMDEDVPDNVRELVEGVDLTADDYGVELLTRSLEKTKAVALWWD